MQYTTETYARDLSIHVFMPDARPRAAIVFFHGGAWRFGAPGQFFRQCTTLAERGIIAASAAYRLVGSSARDISECMQDARDAVAWMRAFAVARDVRADMVLAGGGSAGGHLAAACALIDGEPSLTEHRPSALLLCNPALDLTPRWSDVGVTAENAAALSPLRRVAAGAPPAIVFHGTADAVIPIETARSFRDAMQSAGSACELVEYEDATHGFFNADPAYSDTLSRMIAFIEEFVAQPVLGSSGQDA